MRCFRIGNRSRSGGEPIPVGTAGNPSPLSSGRLQAVSPWLDPLAFDWRPLRPHATEIQVRKHQVIHHQGEPARHVFVVRAGRVRLFLCSPDGRDKALAILGRNGLLGEFTADERRRHELAAVAVTPVRLWRLDAGRFLDLTGADAGLRRQVLEFMSLQVRLLATQSYLLAYASPLQRICSAFLHLGFTYGRPLPGGAVEITVPFTQQELAELVGVSRVTVALNLGRLRRLGLIDRDGRRYRVLDPDALSDLLTG